MSLNRICVITFPIKKAGNVPLSNLLHILSSISKEIYLITGNEGTYNSVTYELKKINDIRHRSYSNSILRVIQYFLTQIKISYALLKIITNVDFVLFFFGGDTLIIPMIMVKLFRKKGILLFSGSLVNTSVARKDKLGRILQVISKINCSLPNNIILYSERLISEWGMDFYRDKILISHRHFVDFNRFKLITEYNKRDNIIGYVGRFELEKGIMNLLSALPRLLEENQDLMIFLIGKGSLEKEIDTFLNQKGIWDRVEIISWIDHDNLPRFLNKCKLIILPSYTEGLPNIMLESMACGTPLIASSVGAIPDVIKDNENGFLLINNEPKTIKKKINYALNSNSLNDISKESIRTIKRDFTFNKTLARFKKVLDDIGKKFS